MVACAIIGDSIALALAAHISGCVVDAKIGISSSAIIMRVQSADTVIVSAGSNDPYNKHLRGNCELIRKIAVAKGAKKIIWVLPANGAGPVVMAVAVTYHDPMVSFVAGRDGVHPASEGILTADVKKEME